MDREINQEVTDTKDHRGVWGGIKKRGERKEKRESHRQ